MKKQILTLTLFVLAVFAGALSSLAQNLTTAPTSCLTPNAVQCIETDNPLSPIAGKEYTYTVDVPTPNGTKNFNWLVTQDKDFITVNSSTGLPELSATPEAGNGSGAHIMAAGANYNTTPGANNVKITWKAFNVDPANPVFLIIYVTNTDACLTDNLEVYIIEPVNAFTLDIANIDINGGTQAADYATCVSQVQSASWDGSKVVVDYGTNYLYYVVNAANWNNAWLPSFQVNSTTGLGARTVSVDWAYPAEAVSGTWNSTTASGSTYTSASNVEASTANGSVGEAGECIIVRVSVDHFTEETIAQFDVELAVDGVIMTESTAGSGTFDTQGVGDVHYAGTAGDGTCGEEDGFTNDKITQLITPRPDINEGTPSFQTKEGF